MAFKILQKIDENGYWIKPVKFFIAPDSKPSKKMVEQALPEGADVQNNFFKWDGEKWVAEKKPTNAEELIGVVIKHSSRTERDLAVRKLIEKFRRRTGTGFETEVQTLIGSSKRFQKKRSSCRQSMQSYRLLTRRLPA